MKRPRPTRSELMDSPDSNTYLNLIPTRTDSADIILSEADAIQVAADSALAPATRRRYRSLWQGFDSWCRTRGYDALPAAAVACKAAGLGSGYSGHSPRVGAAQAAANLSLPAIMQHGRWQSPTMVAKYTRDSTAAQSAMAKYYASQ